jgi:hypothetical protein
VTTKRVICAGIMERHQLLLAHAAMLEEAHERGEWSEALDIQAELVADEIKFLSRLGGAVLDAFEMEEVEEAVAEAERRLGLSSGPLR